LGKAKSVKCVCQESSKRMHYLLASQLGMNEPRKGIVCACVRFYIQFLFGSSFFEIKKKIRIIEWVISKLKQSTIFI
jgi:hypothetical protein